MRVDVQLPAHGRRTGEDEIDLGGALRLREALSDVLTAGCTQLVLDLRKVTFIDSSGSGGDLRARRRRAPWRSATSPPAHDSLLATAGLLDAPRRGEQAQSSSSESASPWVPGRGAHGSSSAGRTTTSRSPRASWVTDGSK